MAIQFARIEIVGRSSGGNACRTGAYNARAKVTDAITGVTYDFTNRRDNLHHEIIIPSHADSKFKDLSWITNEVERFERQCNSQLLKHFVIALPDDKEFTLEDRLEITYRVIKKMQWVEEGLVVAIDIHEPHEGEHNNHAHGWVSTRRVAENGKEFHSLKARDLNPKFCNGRIIPEEVMMHVKLRDVINEYCKEKGWDLRVDEISTVPGEHVGAVRMRSVLNGAVERNELRAIAHLENIKDEHGVLDRITRRQAVFTSRDLERAVKEIDNPERRLELVERALRSDRVLKLYDPVAAEMLEGNHDKGGKGGRVNQVYYTTKEVRAEEQRCLRVADKVNDLPNFGDTKGLRGDVLRVRGAGAVVSEVQGKVLSDLLLADQGLRVLRGRAGTGKSHVLGLVRELSAQNGKHVIGLAPTHKAVEELQRKGFNDTDTVKGFLFTYKNGKNYIPSGSLVVVDEAGMIETAGMLELLKVARSRACNVILAGDERQNASIERGGMFEVLADRFGSSELSDIRRQDAAWGREMASCLANYDIKAGIKILQEHKGLRVSESLEASMNRLIKDYVSSEYALNEKLVISLRNVEVDALNIGIREALKEKGVIGGSGVAAIDGVGDVGRGSTTANAYNVTTVLHSGEKTSREYVCGERILFTATDKDHGIKNGEFATLTSVTKGKFVALLDNGTEVSFDPVVLHKFTYGYASTVYKAQGASIKFVAMLHNGIGNARNSYVALTRHVEQIVLYCNKEVTKSVAHLVRQLEGVSESSSSLKFVSDEDIANLKEQSQKQPGFFERIGGAVKNAAIAIGDRVHRNPEYYEYKATKDKVSQVMVEEALEELSMKSEMGREDTDAIVLDNNVHEKIAVGQSHRVSSMIAPEVHTFKDGGKSNANSGSKVFSKSIVKSGGEGAQRSVSRSKSVTTKYNKFDSEVEMAELKRAMGPAAELIACSLLGEPNRHLSNKVTLRFGETGKLAVGISGSKSGMWYDFSEAQGGDLIALVARERNSDFKGAKEYIGGLLGVLRSNVSYIHTMSADERYKDAVSLDQKEKNNEAAKIKRAQSLYMKAQTLAIVADDHIAKRYLTEHRGIENVINEGKLSPDLQTTSMWDNHTKQHYDSLVVMARNDRGEITGGQAIYLDKESAKKAEVPVNKRSFGKISGSFVTIQSGLQTKDGNKDDNQPGERVTIIAEGVETALSIQEAGVSDRVKILCSLGVSNIKNYEPYKGEKILICADNDGLDASSLKAIEQARIELEDKGAIVNIVMPQEEGKDFNDALKAEGADAVHNHVKLALEKLHKDNGLDRIVSKISAVCNNDQSIASNTKLAEQLSELKNLAPASLHQILDVCRSEGAEKGLESIDTLLKNTKVQKQQQFDSFLNYHTKTLKDIEALDPKFDTKALIEHLNDLGKDLTPKDALKVQNSHIDSVLVKTFQDKVSSELAAINKGFEEAKSPMDVMQTLQREKELYADIDKNYWRLTRRTLTKDQHEKYMYNAVFHEKHPEYLKNLERDVGTLSKLEIWPEDKITDTLRSEHNFFTLEKKLFKGCQDHITHDVMHDLKIISEDKSIEREGHKFEDHKSYLEHRMNDKDHGHYLTETKPHKMLKQIYKVEQAKLDQQKELEMHKTMDKGHDMSM